MSERPKHPPELERLLNRKHDLSIQDRLSLDEQLELGRINTQLKTFWRELGHCCPNEDRTMAGGCRSCGDPSY